MTNPAIPSDPKSADKDPSQAGKPGPGGSLSFEEMLHRTWVNNRELVVGLCALVLLGIAARGGWAYFASQRELNVEKEYADATTHDGLQSFADAHSDNPLAGIAELRLADEAYAAHQLPAALSGYERAITVLKSPILVSRAQLGEAICQVESGQAAEGEQALRQLAGDPKQFKALRAEATYHLASLAAATGRPEQVKQFSEQLMQIDPASPWTQRAFELQSSLPAAAAPAGPPAPQPGVSFQPQPFK